MGTGHGHKAQLEDGLAAAAEEDSVALVTAGCTVMLRLKS